MEAAGATLPEFNHLGKNLEPTPMRRAGHLLGVFFVKPLIGLIQYRSVGNDLALRGGPGTVLAFFWAGLEIGIAEGLSRFFRPAFDSDLTLQGRPENTEGQAGVFR